MISHLSTFQGQLDPYAFLVIMAHQIGVCNWVTDKLGRGLEKCK